MYDPETTAGLNFRRFLLSSILAPLKYNFNMLRELGIIPKPNELVTEFPQTSSERNKGHISVPRKLIEFGRNNMNIAFGRSELTGIMGLPPEPVIGEESLKDKIRREKKFNAHIYQTRNRLETSKEEELPFQLYRIHHFDMFVFAPMFGEEKGITIQAEESYKKNLDRALSPLLEYILTAKKTKGEDDKYGLKLPLTIKEFKMAGNLIANFNKVVPHTDMIISIWGEQEFENMYFSADQYGNRIEGLRVLKSRTQKVIRSEFEDLFAIENIRGYGYELIVNN